jgi:hypothetical protein
MQAVNQTARHFAQILLQPISWRIIISDYLIASLQCSDYILLISELWHIVSEDSSLFKKSFLLIVSHFLIFSFCYKIAFVISYKKFFEIFQHIARFYPNLSVILFNLSLRQQNATLREL